MERCPPDEVTACPLRDTAEGCFINRHHLYYPSTEYRTSVEKRFRNLGENVITLCAFKHRLLHLEKPPRKPDIEVMRQAVEQARSAVPTEPPEWHNWIDDPEFRGGI